MKGRLDQALCARDLTENRPVQLEEIARTSIALSEMPARLGKIDRLASCLRRLRPEEVPVAVAYLSGRLRQGTIGVGWASLRELPPSSGSNPSLELLEVDAGLGRIAGAAGPGSRAIRRHELTELFGRATEVEQRFLAHLLQGGLRQGALEGVMAEAVAKASGVPASEVRRALMLSGGLGLVARVAVEGGRQAIAHFRLQVLTPIQPMLAQSAQDLQAAMRRIPRAAVEWKLDGARLQVHRRGPEVRVFTRNLADVTARVPEVVETIARVRADSLVLDGEVIALRPDGRPQPFQVTMSRFGSKLSVDRLRPGVPLSPFFFDCLHLDGEDLIDRPAAERFAVLRARIPEDCLIPRTETDALEAAEQTLNTALARGHEGVMVKALGAPYEAGRRGASWLKVKQAHTLDLVVLGAEWGHGRRRGWLSNLHLGARDPGTADFVMLGQTFKGMTDEMLAWQTERLQEIATRRDGTTVFVRPELVVEVAFDGVQDSSRYPGGVALRFARIKGYRPDKRPEEADTIDTVRAIRSGGEEGSGRPPRRPLDG